MSVHLTQHQLDQLADGTFDAVVVEDSATKRKYAVLAETIYQRARPLLELIGEQVEPDRTDGNGVSWTEADNERRIALINKKHDGKLSKSEREGLSCLQDRAYRHRNQVAPVRNEVLRLLLEALEHRAISAD